MVLLTALADRCIGLEQEFFLVDEDGILSNRADKFLFVPGGGEGVGAGPRGLRTGVRQ